MNILKATLFFFLLSISQWAHTAYPKTDYDFALLPPWCKAKLGDVSEAERKLWERRIGPGWIHVHHYCAALFTLNLSYKVTDRNQLPEIYKVVVGEIAYVEKNTSPKFKLWPKMQYDKGQVLEKMNDTAGAMRAYQESIQANPKLPLSYAALSDLYKKQKNNKEAIVILEQGLKHKPESKVLLKRLAILSKGK
ncbi:MAG: tetratricopeptide repeat protein [Methylobacter sp.]|nr:tetratricopeptide repeat protein [Methylobacter sp.]